MEKASTSIRKKIGRTSGLICLIFFTAWCMISCSSEDITDTRNSITEDPFTATELPTDIDVIDIPNLEALLIENGEVILDFELSDTDIKGVFVDENIDIQGKTTLSDVELTLSAQRGLIISQIPYSVFDSGHEILYKVESIEKTGTTCSPQYYTLPSVQAAGWTSSGSRRTLNQNIVTSSSRSYYEADGRSSCGSKYVDTGEYFSLDDVDVHGYSSAGLYVSNTNLFSATKFRVTITLD